MIKRILSNPVVGFTLAAILMGVSFYIAIVVGEP